MKKHVSDASSVITFSAQDLSDDCRSVEAGGMVPSKALAEAEILQRLDSFAAITKEALVGGDPRIRLTTGANDFLVRRENGHLAVRSLTSDSRASVRYPATQIVQMLEAVSYTHLTLPTKRIV